MKNRDLQMLALGAYGAVVVFVAVKWVTSRLDRIERAARTFPSMEPPKSLDDLQRESVQRFVATLREEGLVVTEGVKDKP